MENGKLANPAVVGLSGFGLTTLLLQFHNIGLIGIGPVFAMAIAFGGLAQFIAGFLEHKMGNNFGFTAFTAYGAFWLGLAAIWLCNHFGVLSSNHHEVGFYLLAWTLFTAILWIGSMFIHAAMAWTFTTLLAGFILLVLGHFVAPMFNVVAGYVLIVCALVAWYMMATIVINQVAGREVLKNGKAWIKK
ncbi:MAG: acetate uptake transporter [Mangrovibacterium sp.]